MFLFKKGKKRDYLDEFTKTEIEDWINGKKNKEIDFIIYRYENYLSNKGTNESFVGFRTREDRLFKILDPDELIEHLKININKNTKTPEYKEHIIATLENEAIKLKERTVFNEYYSLFQQAINLEKINDIDGALRIYFEILNKYIPEGSSYYERPCILLEKLKRYDEAIEICNLAIIRIENYNFNFSVDDFKKRLDRLIKKKNN